MSKEKGQFNYWWLVIVPIIVLLVIFWPGRTSENGKVDEEKKDETVLEDVTEEEEVVETAEKQEPRGDGELVMVETTELSAVGHFGGSGEATRVFSEGNFLHSVTATLSDPEPGKFYEGWLVKKTPELSFFSTGKLIKEGDKYVVYYEMNENKNEFNEVVITQETKSNGLDGQPEDHVLEGSF